MSKFTFWLFLNEKEDLFSLLELPRTFELIKSSIFCGAHLSPCSRMLHHILYFGFNFPKLRVQGSILIA